MEMDLAKVTNLELDTDITFDSNLYKNDQIKRIDSAHVKGYIHLNEVDILEIHLELKGNMILSDSVTLEDICYPYIIHIEEEYSINDPYFEEYYKKNQNILDIMAILWENIVLEVPIRFTKTNDALLSGNGWRMGSNENKNDNIDPRLAKLAQILDEGKE